MSCAAVLQMTSTTNVRANLAELEPFFAQAERQGVELLVLPENFALMGQLETDKLQHAEVIGHGLIQDTIGLLAKRYQLWVIAGTIPIIGQTSERILATSLVYNAQGEIVAHYAKMHLFDVRISEQEAHQESRTIEPGDKVVVVDTPVGRIGLTVCYDMRFPELYRHLVLQGAEIFAVPAAFTAVTGLAHWEVLLRARAIENLAYVLGANQCGSHDNGRHTFGHSMIIDPWGKILSQAATKIGLVVADLDLTMLRQLRHQFPCNDHHVLGT